MPSVSTAPSSGPSSDPSTASAGPLSSPSTQPSWSPSSKSCLSSEPSLGPTSDPSSIYCASPEPISFVVTLDSALLKTDRSADVTDTLSDPEWQSKRTQTVMAQAGLSSAATISGSIQMVSLVYYDHVLPYTTPLTQRLHWWLRSGFSQSICYRFDF
jgi:hypothetical protein